MSIALTLVPTPIAEAIPLEAFACALLKAECLLPDVAILVEEHKTARIRWIEWGLPREAIERFQLLNEHTEESKIQQIIHSMKSGMRFYLLSDTGLPAFCDPGQKLVNACHLAKLRVSSTPFPNSIALSLALSGFSHHRFYFVGFLPANTEERKRELEKLSKVSETLILMDTPYRMGTVLKDLAHSGLNKRMGFLAMDLNSKNEVLIRGRISDLSSQATNFGKREFVLVLDQAAF